MQLIYIGFGVGSVITPQIAKPFLPPKTNFTQVLHTSDVSGAVPGAVPDTCVSSIVRRIIILANQCSFCSLRFLLAVQKESLTYTWPYQENPALNDTDVDSISPLAVRNSLQYAFFIGAALCIGLGSLFFIFLAVRPMIRFKENTPRHMRSTFIVRQSATPHHWMLRALQKVLPCLVSFRLVIYTSGDQAVNSFIAIIFIG